MVTGEPGPSSVLSLRRSGPRVRHAYPGLASYSLDTLLTHTQIPIPAARHRAMPDAAATAALLPRLLTDGATRHRWSRLDQLLALAGRPAPSAAAAEQPTLF